MSDLLISVISPWFVTFCGLVVVVVSCLSVRRIWLAFRSYPLKFQCLLIICIVIGFWVRFAYVPNQPRIYYDEDRYLSYAVTFARFGKEIGLNAATPTTHISGEPDYVARITVPTLNAWILKSLGYDTLYLFLASKFFSSIQVILVFILTSVLFKKPRISLLATALFSVIPTAVFWSVSIALDSYFVFFSLLCAIAAADYARNQTYATTLFLIGTTMLTLFVRFEAFLILPIVVSLILSIRKTEHLPLFTQKDLRALLLAFPFISLRAFVSLSVLGKTWCCGEATPLEAFSTSYIIRNTIPNLQSLFVKPEFPWIISVCAMIAIFGKKDLKIIPLILWIISYFFIYSFYFAGMFFTYTFSGSYGRYFLMLIPPLIMLAATTIDDAMTKLRGKKRESIIICVFVFITLLPTIKNYRSMIYISPYDTLVDAMPRANRYFLEEVMMREVPENAVVVHPLTGLTLLHGRTAVYFGSLLSSNKVRSFTYQQAKNGIPIYMWQTHTCDNTPEKCQEVLKLFDIVPVKIKGENLTKLEMAQLILKEASSEATASKEGKRNKNH